jgi:hypothetical protein
MARFGGRELVSFVTSESSKFSLVDFDAPKGLALCGMSGDKAEMRHNPLLFTSLLTCIPLSGRQPRLITTLATKGQYCQQPQHPTWLSQTTRRMSRRWHPAILWRKRTSHHPPRNRAERDGARVSDLAMSRRSPRAPDMMRGTGASQPLCPRVARSYPQRRKRHSDKRRVARLCRIDASLSPQKLRCILGT